MCCTFTSSNKTFNTLHRELRKNKRRPGPGSLILAEILPGRSTRTATDQRAWFQHECRLLDMLVYIKRTNQGGKGGHASEANSLVQDARDILAEASSCFSMGGASSLCRGCGCRASTSTHEPASHRCLPTSKESTQREARPHAAHPCFHTVTASLAAVLQATKGTSGSP